MQRYHGHGTYHTVLSQLIPSSIYNNLLPFQLVSLQRHPRLDFYLLYGSLQKLKIYGCQEGRNILGLPDSTGNVSQDFWHIYWCSCLKFSGLFKRRSTYRKDSGMMPSDLKDDQITQQSKNQVQSSHCYNLRKILFVLQL